MRVVADQEALHAQALLDDVGEVAQRVRRARRVVLRDRADAYDPPALAQRGDRRLQLLAAHARRVLRLLDTLVTEARGAERGVAEGPLRVAAFRSAALHLLPAALERLAARHPGIRPEVRVVRELGPGTAGEVAEGRAELGIATLGGSSPVPAGLIGGVLLDEPYSLVHPAGHPDPRSLPLVDWHENCGSYTRAWWAGQDWIPRATVLTEDDGAVLSMVANGHGMAIMPALSLAGAPDSVEITDLGADRPTRSVGYVTTPELASSVVVRALIRELRAAHA
ncbi:LysR substrate-binding domain-containing protein [Streptomyces sp. NPDC015345]|uniref:LysR substrate-binding domain-containing protein n=1 Tax=Streptomyces sp. NPDC015345 TaxID=3364953 RepID=UPI0036FBE867